MSIPERTAIITIPSDECPFCGPGMMSSGIEYSTTEPGEYYYRCSCGAGEDDRACPDPDGFGEDLDGTPLTQWIIGESMIPDLRPEWRNDAREYLGIEES